MASGGERRKGWRDEGMERRDGGREGGRGQHLAPSLRLSNFPGGVRSVPRGVKDSVFRFRMGSDAW